MVNKSTFSRLAAGLFLAANMTPAIADNGLVKASNLIPTLLADVPTVANAGSIYPAVNHKTNRIYVPNIEAGSVSVIDDKAKKLITTIAIDSSKGASGSYASGPAGIAIDEARNIVYVVTNNGTLSAVDGKTNKVKYSFVFDTVNNGPEGFSTGNLVFSTKTGKLYVSNADVQIDVIDPIQKKVITTIPDDTAYTLAIDQSKNLIYVNNLWDAQIAVIDGDTDQFTPTLIDVGRPAVPNDCYKTGSCTDEGSHPDGIALDQNGHRLYVGLSGDGATGVVDTLNNVLIKTLPVGGYVAAVDTVTHAAYVSDYFGNLAVIDHHSDSVVASGIQVANGIQGLPTDNLLGGIVVNSNLGRIYVANYGYAPYGLPGPNQLLILQLP